MPRARATLIRAGTAALRVVPLGLAQRVARCAADLCWLALPARRATLEENLAHLAPALGPAARRRLARATFRNLAHCTVDLLRLPLLSRAQLLALFDLGGLDALDAALAEGRGAIIVTPHVGNYDLGGAWLAARGYAVSAFVEELAADDHAAMSQLRAATGLRLLSHERDAREALRVLARNEVLLIVADRVIGAAGAGGAMLARFGAGTRRVPMGPARLALRTRAPVFIGHIHLDLSNGRRPRYLGRLERLALPATPEAATPAHLTQCIASAFTAIVQRHPDQWFVFQPEWSSAGV